jgi:hypothetical protein
VLENHHAATAFRILKRDDCNVLGALTQQDRSAVRSMMIEMILTTDMAKHFQFLSRFRALVEAKKILSGDAFSHDLTSLRWVPWT